MTTQIQRRRGTTAQHSTFTGAVGEVTVDTDKEVLVVHDGAQAGGYPQMRENGSNSALALGSASTPSLKFAGDTNTGIYSPGPDQVAISTGGSGRLFVDASGNVILGTTSILSGAGGRVLQIGNTSDTASTLQFATTTTGSSQIQFGDGDSPGSYAGYLQYTHTNNAFSIGTNSTEKLRITSAGLVGVGTSAPVWPLDVRGSGNFFIEDGFLGIDAQSSPRIGFAKKAGSTPFLAVGSDTSFQISHSSGTGVNPVSTNTYTPRLTIDTSGRVGIGTTTVNTTLEVLNSSAPIIRVGDGLRHVQLWGGSSTQNQAVGTATAASFGFNINSSEVARFDTSGRFLVGTSSTSANTRLLVAGGPGSSNGSIRLSTSSTTPASGETLSNVSFANNAATHATVSEIACVRDGGTWTNGTSHPTRLEFSTTADGASSPTERMRIRSDGKIQIGGTGITDARLNVVTSASERLGQFISQNTGGDAATFGLYIGKYSNDSTTTQRFIGFSINNDGSGCGQINANGSGQAAFGTFSDQRLKENIQDLPSQLGLIKALRPVEFDFKDGNGHQLGFIAQEMQQVYPDVVSEQDGYLTITGFGKTECRLIKALQEAVAKIETLEAKVAALESA